MTSERTPRLNGAATDNAVIGWLFVIALMIFVMIVLGGVTRLTESGLSMVEWKPLRGWLPPMTMDDWNELFDKYRRFPEFIENNPDMTVYDFKNIFWLEFIHRVWGRLIGVVFFVPMVVFFIRKRFSKKMMVHALTLFVLGGLQGGLGWFMVKSGLVDRPDVSQYRLVAHLGLAVFILGYTLIVAFDLLKLSRSPNQMADGAGVNAFVLTASRILPLLIFITLLSGGFVAGLDAGLVFNTFPMMDGEWIPSTAFELSPVYLNAFENVALVQFDHRLLAIISVVAILYFRIKIRGTDLPGYGLRAANYLTIVVLIQAVLGISTLLLAVPIPLAAMHQAGAIVLFSLSIWLNRELHQHSSVC